MNTSNKKPEEVSVLLSTIISMILLLSFFASSSAFGRDKISASKTFGAERDRLGITLSSKTVLKLEVLPETFKDGTKLTLSEADVIPYNKDIIGLLSVKIENDDITHKIKKPLIIKAFPVNAIDQSRVEMIQAFILKTKKSGKQYWSRVPFRVDKIEDSINLFIEEPGIYKIQYSKLKVGNSGTEGFFKLNKPNKSGGDADFSLYFTGTGDDVYFFVEDEFGYNLWDESEDGVTTITSSGWFSKPIDDSHFINIKDLAYLKDRGKFEVTCYDQNVGWFDDELWGAWFIRDQDSISSDKDLIKRLLDKYSPCVYFGNYNKSLQADKNPWGYNNEMATENGEIYYPVDIRDFVKDYSKALFTDNGFYDDYHVSVGDEIGKVWSNKLEMVLENANIIKEDSNNGIDVALYNDKGLKFGITRTLYSGSEKYELLEFEGTEQESYLAAIDTNPSYPKGTYDFSGLQNKSKIYGTAYEYKEYIFLTYFFYYPFDPKNGDDNRFKSELSRHSGDWERFVVVLNKDNNAIQDSKAVGAFFFHHLSDQTFTYYEDDLDNEKFSWNNEKTCPGAYVQWGSVEKTNNHPNVYIAQGSHGIYFRQGSYAVKVWGATLSEYAGGQAKKEYIIDKNLIYLPRLSEIDTKSNNPEFGFLLFSGAIAQIFLSYNDICFPPYNDVWYAVDKYCFDGNGVFKPKNNVSDYLSITTPTVSITNPQENAILIGTVEVAASASAISNIEKVEFYLDNIFQQADSSKPYSWNWDTKNSTNGHNQLKAKAYDIAGNVGESPPISVTVNNTSDNKSPNIPTDLAQYKSNGVTGIAVGGSTNERTVVMKGKVTDPDNNPVSLEVEFKPVGTSFSNTPSPEGVSGGTVASGQIAVVTCYGLADGQYHWQARAKDSKGAVSNWLSAGGNSESVPDFIVSASSLGNYPPVVTVNAPNGGETLKVGTSYEIKWTATDTTGTIQRIDIYRSNDDGGSWSTIASNETNDGSYLWTPSTQTAQGRIKVEATDSFGAKGNDMSNGNFSVVSNCQAPSVPTLYSITSSSNSYYVTWSAASGASYYNLQEDDSSSFSSPMVVYTNNGLSWYSGDKLPGTYYYRVKAINNCGESGWSSTQSVTIKANQGPGEIIALSPADGAVNQPLSLTLSWSASHAGGESLRYNVYVVEADTTIFYPNNIKSFEQTGKTYSISSIPYNTVISWGIEAIDDTGDRRFSSMFHFTTIGDNGAPTGSILINNGAASTTSYSVTLNLSATDSGSGVRDMRLSNDGTHWTEWVRFSTQYSWNMADTNYGGQYGFVLVHRELEF
ncbi:MAG: hypothetical protein HW406_1132 [Candidatus Brocadiaceae bacterium]|nr:hypothetical protein [Candidatus Brocadiaceae bacterium]